MKKYIGILVCLVALLGAGLFVVQPTQADSPTLLLENKDPDTWAVENDDISGILNYNTSGVTFDFSLTATGLSAGTSYSLIYYANPWPGNNPGKLIWTGLSDDSGSISTGSQSVDLGMNLPTAPDSNMVVSHEGAPDYYTTHYGAKIWLVLSVDYDTDHMTAWHPASYLFETNLINYTDTNLQTQGSGVDLTTTVTEPQATIGLSVSPPSFNFGQVQIGYCSSENVLTLTNTGNVAIKVTATTSAGFYANCLQINDAIANGWVSPKIEAGDHLNINLRVCPINGYKGTVAGSVSFVASFAP